MKPALLLALALLLWPAVAATSPEEDARRRYDEATALFRGRRFVEAARLFEEAYRLAPHRHSLLFNVAACYQRAFETGGSAPHLREAIRFYEAFQRAAPAQAPDADAPLAQLRAALRREAARRPLVVTQAAGPDGIVVRAASDPLGLLRAARLHYRVAGAGPYAAVRRSIGAQGEVVLPWQRAEGAALEYHLEALGAGDVVLAQLGSPAAPLRFGTPTPPAPSPAPSSMRTPAWVTLGAGAASLVAGATLWALAKQQEGELDCPGGACPPSQHGTLDSFERLQTGAKIGVAVGLVGVTAGAVLLFAF